MKAIWFILFRSFPGLILFFLISRDCNGQACNGHWVRNQPLTFQCISGQQIGLPPMPDPMGCPTNPTYTALQTNTYIFDNPVNDFFIDFNAFSSASGCARLQIKINGIFFPLSIMNLLELPIGTLCSGSVTFLTVTSDGFITTNSSALPNSNGQGRLVFSGVNASSITISTNDSGGGSVVGSPCMTPLPLQIISLFGFITDNCTVHLNFASGIESNVQIIEVEESADGSAFRKTLEILPTGNDSRYTVSFRSNGSNLFRLKIIDLDGSYEFSEVLFLKTKCNQIIPQIHPNPAQNFIKVSNIVNGDNVRILDLQGRVIIDFKDIEVNNRLDVTRLAPAIYLLQIIRGEKVICNLKLVKK